jgi:predicted nuclease with TOPRIM domain
MQLRHEHLAHVSKKTEKLLAENDKLQEKLEPLQALPPSMSQAEERVRSLRQELSRTQANLDNQMRVL